MLTAKSIKIIYEEIFFRYEESCEAYALSGGADESYARDSDDYGEILTQLEEKYPWLVPDEDEDNDY